MTTIHVYTCNRPHGCSTPVQRRRPSPAGQPAYCSRACTAAASRYNLRIADPLRARLHGADMSGVKRARAVGRRATLIGTSVLLDLWRAQEGACLTCLVPLEPSARQGAPGSPELAHLTPLAVGGEHGISNVGFLCGRCNQAQRDTTGMEATVRIVRAAVGRGRGVAALHAAMTRNR